MTPAKALRAQANESAEAEMDEAFEPPLSSQWAKKGVAARILAAPGAIGSTGLKILPSSGTVTSYSGNTFSTVTGSTS